MPYELVPGKREKWNEEGKSIPERESGTNIGKKRWNNMIHEEVIPFGAQIAEIGRKVE